MHYAEGVAAGSCIAADAGTAGYWVARTLGTTKLGSVIVPSTSLPGFAAACVAVSLLRHPARPALAVTDGQEEGEVTVAVVDAAKTLGLDVPVEAWDPEGERLDAEAHRARLYQLLNGERPSATGTVTLATDPRQLDEMLDVAGPIVAWT
jgi:hypothetical protein